MFVQSDDIFDDETVLFVDEFAKDQLAEYPDELLTASSIVTRNAARVLDPAVSEVSPSASPVDSSSPA